MHNSIVETTRIETSRSFGNGKISSSTFVIFFSFQEAQSELDTFNKTVQSLARLSQSIARESGESNASTEMNSLLQICFDKLRHIQEYLPSILRRNQILLGHLQKFDEGLDEYRRWFNEARQTISRYSLQVSLECLDDNLQQHRVSSNAIKTRRFLCTQRILLNVDETKTIFDTSVET